MTRAEIDKNDCLVIYEDQFSNYHLHPLWLRERVTDPEFLDSNNYQRLYEPSLIIQNIIIKNPKSVFVVLIVALLSFGYYSKDFRLDASSDTLLIEGDPDLEYLREVTQRYGSKEFLILTYSPNEGMITDSSICLLYTSDAADE